MCISCTTHMPFTHYHGQQENDTVLRFAGRLKFEQATSLAYFTADGLLQHLLHELKYKDKQEIGVYLGKQLGYALKQTDWIKSVDGIVPVPLHPKKEAARGYNQSRLIAEGLNEILQLPICDRQLYRSRHTESQTKKSREERIENMSNVFAVKGKESLTGKHLLLVDDVLTTGATLEACALALQAATDIRISFGTIGIAMD